MSSCSAPSTIPATPTAPPWCVAPTAQIVAKVRASGHEAWYLWARDEGHGFHKADNLEAEREVETLFFRHVFEK